MIYQIRPDTAFLDPGPVVSQFEKYIRNRPDLSLEKYPDPAGSWLEKNIRIR